MSTLPILGMRRSLFAICVVMGVAYGIIARFVFGSSKLEGAFEIMSISFIFVVPLVIGYLTIALSPADETPKWGRWIALPWTTSLLTIFITLLLAWEGLICAVVWIPLFLVMSSIGGVFAGLVRRGVDSGSTRGMMLASLVIFPFLLSPLEQRSQAGEDFHIVENRIEIDATPSEIWEQIREVAPIRDEETEWSFTHWIGFPEPIEARLIGEGVGSVRHATFEGDVLFRETVTAWKPDSLLSFTIAPDSGIPPTTFDEHVVVGGRYFDVLEGTYTIEPVAPGRCILHLTSRQRLSTRFNAYTSLWTDFFMSDIQQSILKVIRKRCD
jgi:hypothetical protein